ncbi:hypothetical protein QQ045_015959 [Rhodiola kirilowii]
MPTHLEIIASQGNAIESIEGPRRSPSMIQSDDSESDDSESDMESSHEMDYKYDPRYLPLFRAALTNDWTTAEAIFNEYPDADTARIAYLGQTTLHIAVTTNKSHSFVEKLVNRIAAKDKSKLRTPGKYGSTLHYAARAGNTNAAKALVGKDPGMALIADGYGNTAVKLAAWYGRKETLVYLLGVTPDETGGEDGMSPYSGVAGGDLITLTISAGFYDVAMKLINEYPNLATEKDRKGIRALQTLATQPSAFPSGRSWWFWEYIIYFCTPLNSTLLTDDAVNHKSEKKPSKLWRKTVLFLAWFKYVPLLKNIHDTKLKHKQTDKLMKVMIAAILNKEERLISWSVLGRALSTATNHGIHELVEECLGHYPGLIWFNIEDGLALFTAAIKYRQVKVFNLVYQMTGHDVFSMATRAGVDNALHLVGRMASQHTLSMVTDVVALFSAVTSLLMFLAILTSRYAEDDFLYALPKRITIGLVSLFISIASIMVTFCAAIALVLREQFAWIALPVGLIAVVPVTFFALLQFPLLVELVLSTYGPSIFHKQNNLILH